MKVWITGCAGFVARHLEKALEKDHELCGNDNFIGADLPPDYLFFPVDCNTQDFSPIVKSFGPEVVFHTAACPHEGLSVFSPNTITFSVYNATISAVTAAIHAGVKRFINCSSMARYGAQQGPFTEEMPTAPVDPYGVAKVAAEQAGRMLCETHGVEWVNLVPHNIIGPGQKYDDPFRNVASIMINRMLQGQQPIIYGDGEQVRCFSSIQDCVKCFVAAIDADIVGETINIGPDSGEMTINQLAQMIADVVGFDLDPIYVPDRPCEVKRATCSSDKARNMLGYESQYTVEEEIFRMVAHIRQYGTKPFNYHLPLEIINDKTPKTWTDKLI